MPRFEYKVVAAPRKGVKAKEARTAEDRFAHAIATLINAQARDGWEYLRTDTLPMEERKGLTGKTTVYQNLLVFRRHVETAADQPRRPVVTAIPGPEAMPAPAETPRLGAPLRDGAGAGVASPALGPAARPATKSPPAEDGQPPD
jgi:hypothetical protein